MAVAALVLGAVGAHAAQPQPWEMTFQPAASPLSERMHDLHNMLLVIITLITLFVTGLLIYVMVKFRAGAHPVPTKTSHNTLIEVLWTVIPVLILVIIAVPSFRLLYFVDKAQDAEMTVKIVGHQWYWSYEYPDQGNFTFDSYIVPDADLKPGMTRLLEVDNKVVVPVGTTIRLLVTSQDVMHSWLMPSLGVQTYAMPGRVNETWVKVNEPGVYSGQCNQICGVNHGFMPISIQALPKDKFAEWVAMAQKKFARNDDGAAAAPVRLAGVDPR